MAISDKLEYLNDTKQLLKDKINNLGGSIDDNTTFRQYANQLQNVYDNLPKTEYQEGTEVNLGKTSKGKLDYENGVVGIGQSSQDSTQGYNLLQAKLQTTTDSGITITNNNDGTFTINGTNTSASVVTFRLDDPILQDYEDGTYTLDKGTTNTDIFIRLMQNQTWAQIITVSYDERLKSQAITNATNTFIYIGIKANATINNVTIKPMFIKGSYTESTIPPFEKYTNGASPNPSYPQEIKYVRGRNRLKVDFEAVSVNGIDFSSSEEEITIKGTTTASANTIVGQITLPKGSYTLSCTNMAYAWGTSRIEVSGTGIDTLSFFSGTLVRQLTLSQETVLTFRAIVSGVGTSVNYKTKIQVEEGSVVHNWLPYNTIEEVVSGKNILGSGIELGGFNEDGTPLSGTSTYRNATPIPIEPNKQYIFSINGTAKNINKFYYDRNMNLISKESNVYPLITTPNNAYYLNIYKGVADGDQKWQIVEGTEANTYTLTYEPYITPTSYQLSLGDIELCGIGDYKDELIYDVDEDKVYLNKRIIKKIITSSYLDGLYVFGLQSINSYGIANFLLQVSNEYIYSSDINGLCNYLSPQVSLIANEQNEGILYQPRNEYIRISQDRAKTKEEFKTYVDNLNANGNPLVIYRALNEVAKEEITGTLKDQIKALYNAHSNNGTTIITSNGNLPMIIKVRGLKGE